MDDFNSEFPDALALANHFGIDARWSFGMLQERTTVAGILSKMQEIISDEPTPLNLHKTASPAEASGLQPDALEAVFANAMREAISPMVQRWVNTHQEELISALGPIFRQWMDQCLPKLVSNGLKEELRLSSGQRSTAH